MWHIVKTVVDSADFDVGEREIAASGQQRFVGEFGESVGESVSEIEGRRVAAFTVFAPGGARDLDLFAIHGDNLETGSNHE
jgi:hypothetical protein